MKSPKCSLCWVAARQTRRLRGRHRRLRIRSARHGCWQRWRRRSGGMRRRREVRGRASMSEHEEYLLSRKIVGCTYLHGVRRCELLCVGRLCAISVHVLSRITTHDPAIASHGRYMTHAGYAAIYRTSNIIILP